MWKNPINYRPCLHCNHLIKKDYKLWQDGYFCDYERDLKLLYCNEKNLFLFPPSAEHKHNALDLGDDLNEPMPIDCKVYEGYLKEEERERAKARVEGRG